MSGVPLKIDMRTLVRLIKQQNPHLTEDAAAAFATRAANSARDAAEHGDAVATNPREVARELEKRGTPLPEAQAMVDGAITKPIATPDSSGDLRIEAKRVAARNGMSIGDAQAFVMREAERRANIIRLAKRALERARFLKERTRMAPGLRRTIVASDLVKAGADPATALAQADEATRAVEGRGDKK